MITVGSLFTGIGGLDLGLERAGMNVRWQVESDGFARSILRRHWPELPRFGDVRFVGSRNLRRVDLIAGGFPCQDISHAGSQEGLTGARSGLWFEFERIVAELRPRYVLVENVPRLRGLGLGTVLGHLAASGFDAEWDCIPACAIGAPHRRDRLFIVAYRARAVRPRRPRSVALAYADRRRLAEHGEAHDDDGAQSQRNDPDRRRQVVADASRFGLEGRVFAGERARERLSVARRRALAGAWSSEPDVGRVAHGISDRVDRLRCLGNAVVPAVAEYIGRRIVAFEASR